MNIETTGKLVISSVAGTAAMTIFSHLVSLLKQEQFNEPETLAILIDRLIPQLKMRDARITAWSIHFITGLVFCLAAVRMKKKRELKPGLMKGILFGAACGVIGVMIWNTVYNVHPDTPPKNMRKFSGHLLLAHIVYGAVTAMGYQFLTEEKKKPQVL